MKHLHLRFSLLLCLLFSFIGSANLYAQKEKKVHGIAKIVVEGNYEYMTTKELIKECVSQARIEALKEAFGELIQSNTNVMDASIDGEDISNFYTETLLSSKAEWLEDTKKPEVRQEMEGDKLVFIAEVWGKVREIEPVTIDINWKILAGDTEDFCENYKFKNKERIFIKFKAPCEGYLAIYILDSHMKKANLLLPTKQNTSGYYHIQPNKEYILFDPNFDQASFPHHYIMTTSCPKEMDQVVLLFSPNKFTRSNVNEGNRLQPQSLSIEDFEKWLVNLRRKHKDLLVDRTKWITIYRE